MTQPRSSLAVALVHYRGVRPGIALTIAAVALLGALVVGVIHVTVLQRTGVLIYEGQQIVRMLHSYNGALDVWRRMASVPDTDPRSEQLREVRDNRGRILRGELQTLRAQLRSVEDAESTVAIDRVHRHRAHPRGGPRAHRPDVVDVRAPQTRRPTRIVTNAL